MIKDICYRPKEEKPELFFNNIDGLFDNAEKTTITFAPEPIEEPKKKRGRPKKEDTKGMVRVEKSERSLSPMESNESFHKSYSDTTKQLQDTIKGIDVLVGQIHTDLSLIRQSKSMKRKFDYISQLSGTEAALIGNRISAIRELNNSITNANKLDFNRAKENKALDDKDDDKAIMDMYSAYVNTPVGSIPVPASFANRPTMSTIVKEPSLAAVPINSSLQIDESPNGLTQADLSVPEIAAIELEQNPNIKTVVVYNQDTHEKYFDVVDVNTGNSVPNISKPGDFILQDMTIDLNNGIARNIHMNLSYPLVVLGNRKFDEY